MPQKFERPFTRDDGTDVTVEISVLGWGYAGSYWNPPEPMETEPGRAWAEDGTEVTLSDAEWERAEQAFHEEPPEADYLDYD